MLTPATSATTPEGPQAPLGVFNIRVTVRFGLRASAYIGDDSERQRRKEQETKTIEGGAETKETLGGDQRSQ